MNWNGEVTEHKSQEKKGKEEKEEALNKVSEVLATTLAPAYTAGEEDGIGFGAIRSMVAPLRTKVTNKGLVK